MRRAQAWVVAMWLKLAKSLKNGCWMFFTCDRHLLVKPTTRHSLPYAQRMRYTSAWRMPANLRATARISDDRTPQIASPLMQL